MDSHMEKNETGLLCNTEKKKKINTEWAKNL